MSPLVSNAPFGDLKLCCRSPDISLLLLFSTIFPTVARFELELDVSSYYEMLLFSELEFSDEHWARQMSYLRY